MAKKAKGDRVQVILECTEQKGTGVPGISRRTLMEQGDQDGPLREDWRLRV